MFHRHMSGAHPARTFASGEGAFVAVSSALVLPALLGVAGLAVEFRDALTTRPEMQLMAGPAIHARILAFNQNDNAAAMTQAARTVAHLNCVAPDHTLVMLDPDSAIGPVEQVTITTPRPLVLSQIILANQTPDVTVRSAARPDQEEGDPSCIIALDPNGPGIPRTGGASVTVWECTVSSNACANPARVRMIE